MTEIYRLVYASHAAEDMSYSELDYILISSKLYNGQNDVTGVLIYRDGYFLQLLEGPFEKVRETMSRIIADKRHKNVRVLDEGPCDKRIFEDWTMHFVDFDLSAKNSQSLNAIFDIFMNFKLPDSAAFDSMFNELASSAQLEQGESAIIGN